MKKLIVVAVSFALLSCGSSNQNNGFTLGINPTRPILITATSYNSSGVQSSATAPYITINAVTLNWTGNTVFQLDAIEFFAQNINTGTGSGSTGSGTGAGTGSSGSSSGVGGGSSFNCSGSGNILTALFANSTYSDSPAGCSGNAGLTPAQYMTNSGNPNAAQQIRLPPVSGGCMITLVSTTGLICSSLPVTINPNPFYNYNIPVQAIGFGEAENNNSPLGTTTGRVNAVTYITIN